jgi:hypothetical protein
VKKLLVCLVMAMLMVPLAVYAQSSGSYYVKADGSNINDGLSESRPFKTLDAALSATQNGIIKKITVIGTLDEKSESTSDINKSSQGSVFWLINLSDNDKLKEVTITGKPNASGAERAVLSAAGSRAGVLTIGDGLRIRLEHIEISGGELDDGKYGDGFDLVGEGTRVTLGPGAVVRKNQDVGVVPRSASSFILDGGEIRENAIGVFVSSGSTFTMIKCHFI